MLCRSCLRAKILAQRSPKVLSVARSTQRSLSSTASTSSTALPLFRRQAAQLPRLTGFAPLSLRAYSSAPASAAQSDSAQPTTSQRTPEKPDYLDDAESVIWDRLASEFSPVELVVQDISGGCGSMYGIEISSERFKDATMLKQQRMVNAVLGDLMKNWHGVQLKTRVP